MVIFLCSVIFANLFQACTGLSGKSSGFGHLSGGNVIECGLGVCRSLLRRNCLVLQVCIQAEDVTQLHIKLEFCVHCRS